MMRGMGIALLLALALTTANARAAAQGPAVKDVIEFTRIVEPWGSAGARFDVRHQLSPDGRNAFVVTRRGELSTDQNHFQILLLDMDPQRLAAGRPKPPQPLLTVSSLVDYTEFYPSIQEPRWSGNSTIVFRMRVNDADFQVFGLNIDTRRLTQLTFSERSVLSFGVSADLERVVYAVAEEIPEMPPGARSIVVDNRPAINRLFALHVPEMQRVRHRYFVVDTSRAAKARPLGEAFESRQLAPLIDVSPDGQWAVLKVREPDRQKELIWISRYPAIAKILSRNSPDDPDPLNYYSPAHGLTTHRLVLFQLSDGQSQFIFDAPDGTTWQYMRNQLWQPDSKSVVIANTHLPVAAADAVAESTSLHVIEYFPASGTWKVIARQEGEVGRFFPTSADASGFVIMDGDKARHFARQSSGDWIAIDEQSRSAASPTGWTLAIHEQLNDSPDMAAVGPGSRRVELTRLNPQFSSSTWGVARAYSWKDRTGRQWDGGLITPNDFDPARRYPLVIQTYGFDPERFYLDGSNLGPFPSAFPGRAFAREGVLVLVMPRVASGVSSGIGSREHMAMFADGVASGIETLAGQGTIDTSRVGIIGFSWTAAMVQDLVTFRDAPIRAATVADSAINSLLGTALMFGNGSNSLLSMAERVGAKPFGESVDEWVRNDPSLHTHCVTAAMRYEAYGMQVSSFADIYAWLRWQYKPAELVLIPKGAHHLSRPSERMISLQGNVDWFLFWLRGEERREVVIPGETPSSLAAQYERWRQMAQMKPRSERNSQCTASSYAK